MVILQIYLYMNEKFQISMIFWQALKLEKLGRFLGVTTIGGMVAVKQQPGPGAVAGLAVKQQPGGGGGVAHMGSTTTTTQQHSMDTGILGWFFFGTTTASR